MIANKKVVAKFSYGQLVIGPPGSGKTTYCHQMNQFLNSLDRRCIVVNLDPGNENMDYKPEIDVMELITLSDTMDNCKLGPNGALVFCIEYLENNLEWLTMKLKNYTKTYIIFDCPGQVELYTHHKSMSRIFEKLRTNLGYNLCAINLIDSHYCSEPTKFISALLLSLNTMLTMGLPHINILSKADLLKEYKDKLLFNLDFYTDVLDLQYLLDVLDSTFSKKYQKLNAAIVSMVEDYGLVTFQPLNVNDSNSLTNIKTLCDKANGYIFGNSGETTQTNLLSCSIGAKTENERFAENLDPFM